MIALEDCLGLCDLDLDEVRAVGEHEHLPEILATALVVRLLQSEDGPKRIRDMFIDNLRVAVRRRDTPHARHLVGALRRFLHTYPEAAPQRRAA